MYLAVVPELGLKLFGESREKLRESILNELRFIWNSIVSMDDDELHATDQKIKVQMQALFQAAETTPEDEVEDSNPDIVIDRFEVNGIAILATKPVHFVVKPGKTLNYSIREPLYGVYVEKNSYRELVDHIKARLAFRWKICVENKPVTPFAEEVRSRLLNAFYSSVLVVKTFTVGSDVWEANNEKGVHFKVSADALGLLYVDEPSIRILATGSTEEELRAEVSKALAKRCALLSVKRELAVEDHRFLELFHRQGPSPLKETKDEKPPLVITIKEFFSNGQRIVSCDENGVKFHVEQLQNTAYGLRSEELGICLVGLSIAHLESSLRTRLDRNWAESVAGNRPDIGARLLELFRPATPPVAEEPPSYKGGTIVWDAKPRERTPSNMEPTQSGRRSMSDIRRKVLSYVISHNNQMTRQEVSEVLYEELPLEEKRKTDKRRYMAMVGNDIDILCSENLLDTEFEPGRQCYCLVVTTKGLMDAA
jgi:hypothetical protein